MSDVPATKLLAVLIDGDNFPPDLADPLFTAVSKLGMTTVRRVYGGTAGIAGWRAASARHSIGLHEAMPGKNATDMKMAIDAMDIQYRAKVGGFCIASSDSDFAELALRLREDGVTVHGFGEEKTSDGFRRACDGFEVFTRPAPTLGDAEGKAEGHFSLKSDDRVVRAAKELKLPPTSATAPKVDLTRKKIEQALRSLSKGRSHVPLTELGNHLPKGKKGQGKLKTRLKALDFKLVPRKDGLTVEVPKAAA